LDLATMEEILVEAEQRVPLCLDLAVVIPTYNERGNIPELLARLEAALQGLTWEVLFVDDDSPDGTAALIRECARMDRRIRLIHRIGRRGLASACIEGILATTAPAIAVMDADMQHDESVLPQMLQALRPNSLHDALDLVIGTRNACGGSMGQFGPARVLISRLGRRVSHCVCRCTVSDPMSGFFLVSRSFFSEVVHNLHGVGFKILVDMLASAGRPVRYAEVGYTFRLRRHGHSKLDVNTAIEYFLLIVEKLTDKLTGRTLPVRFAAFALVGTAGVATHMLCVAALIFGFHWHFLGAQIAATYVAMTENFFLNNLVTWRDRSLRGARLVTGLASFWLACSFGAWANVVFARAVLHYGAPWYLACGAGIMLSSVWNYSMANLFTWQNHRPEPAHCPTLEVDSPIYDLDISL
jgi:dolichol-phosphate mannosyltransferase